MNPSWTQKPRMPAASSDLLTSPLRDKRVQALGFNLGLGARVLGLGA